MGKTHCFISERTFYCIEKIPIYIIIITFKKPISNVCIGIGVGIVWLGTTVSIMYATGVLSFAGSNKIAYLPVWLTACFLNVIMQELLIRGYIYQLVKRNYNAVSSIIITTVLFTVMHGGAFETGIVAVLNVIMMSVFMSLVLEYTGSIVAPILMHTVWNCVGAIVLGGVSLAEDYPHLLNSVFSGNNLLSGGISKIEGSVVVLTLNILLSASFFILLRKKKVAEN